MASIISLINPVKLTDFDIIAAVITVPMYILGHIRDRELHNINSRHLHKITIMLLHISFRRLSTCIGITVFYTCLRVLGKNTNQIQHNSTLFILNVVVVIIRDISSCLFDLSEMPIIGNWRLICRFVHRTRTRAYSSP